MKVVIAIDSSPASQYVLDKAAARPWPRGTTFCVLNVVDCQLFVYIPELLEDAKRDARRMVQAGAEKVSIAGHETLSEVMVGYPRRNISEYAKEWKADLIMAGSHGRSAIGRFLLGSVAQGILRTAHCSVEIVRSAEGTPPSSSHPMKILLATDGSDCSLEAANSVARRPWPDGTVFRVMSVQELLMLDNQMDASSLCPVYPSSLIETMITVSRDRATSATKAARKIFLSTGKKVLNGDAMPVEEPRNEILDAAKTWGADLIVLGSHGRRGMDRFFLGSVSEAVAIHAHCSVEVVQEQ